ncbi:MAG: PSD1 domain-containing protein [Gemmatimonadaceae bacterium]|nr:PSD1 domain-containing protein [Gemmatimonadaceae bacterium]
MILVGVALLRGRGTLDTFGGTVDFNRDVRPILNRNCVQCHGGVRRQGELSLLFREDALRPAKSGKRAIVPGNPGASEMIRRITHADPHDRMPKGKESLSSHDIAILRRWIAQGATWQDHWAFVKPVAAPLPAVSNSQWPRTDLDRFVLARLDAEHLTPSPEADCNTLARRVSIDLIGLPPTLAQVDAACADGIGGGYGQLVDTLLASPRFGERWATMWLDVARYADSKGYETDPGRPMWPYRDYVINAFNRDLPFDQFTIEQLAGDLLPNPTTEQRVATAFHRNTMTNNEGGTDDEEYRVAAVIDRVNTTWVAWQGTSIGCAQCHGHPYDPIRNNEFYRAFAIFNNSEDWDQFDEYPVLPSFADSSRARGMALFDTLETLRAELDSVARLPELELARRRWEGELSVPAVAGKINGTSLNEVRRIVRTPEAARDVGQRALLRLVFSEVSDHPELKKRREQRGTVNKRFFATKPMLTPVMRDLPPARRRTTRMFERGNFLVQTDVVQPGVPVAIAPALERGAENRLGLAKALVSSQNPLTARVTVNRFWEQLFGVGLVETSEDFGTQGTPPSHPELLDWMALRFSSEQHWRVKTFLRELVLSATYRQSSAASPALHERDPANRLLARGPRFRMSAEQVRDVALAASGLLSDRMFGPSVMPPQPDGVWQRPYSGEKWVIDTGANGHRRALYTLWKRTAPYPSLVTFDSPSHEFSVARRVRTNTPLQALVTLNDPVYTEAAQALAKRMMPGGPLMLDSTHIDGALVMGYRLALQRAPAATALTALRTLYLKSYQYYAAHPAEGAEAAGMAQASPSLAALSVVASSILNLDAFITKE